MAKLVSKTYGDALFSVAKEDNRIEELYEASAAIRQVLSENADFGKLIGHPGITKEEKIEVVETVFQDKVPSELTGLMKLMIEKGRFSDLEAVLLYFEELVKEEKKIGKATVTTAIPLNDEKKAQVEKKLLETTEYESFEMCYQVDESLIGGMVVRIGDRVADSSVKTKLYNMSRLLQNTSVGE